MYETMQESGLTEIIPLISTSAVRSQYAIVSHPAFGQHSPVGSGYSLMVSRWQVFFPSRVPSGLTSSLWRTITSKDVTDLVY